MVTSVLLTCVSSSHAVLRVAVPVQLQEKFDMEHGRRLPILHLILWSDGTALDNKGRIKAQVVMASWGKQASDYFRTLLPSFELCAICASHQPPRPHRAYADNHPIEHRRTAAGCKHIAILPEAFPIAGKPMRVACSDLVLHQCKTKQLCRYDIM